LENKVAYYYILQIIVCYRQTDSCKTEKKIFSTTRAAIASDSVVCFQYCLFVGVCLSVNAITLEPFEISSWNFYVSEIWSEALMSSKMVSGVLVHYKMVENDQKTNKEEKLRATRHKNVNQIIVLHVTLICKKCEWMLHALFLSYFNNCVSESTW